MSKISVFKFSLNGQNFQTAKSLVDAFIIEQGLNYDSDMNAYISGKANEDTTKEDAVKSIVSSTAATLVNGRPTILGINSIERGFECNFFENELTIKAYLFQPKTKFKHIIHSTFNNSQQGALYYSDLKRHLFKLFEENNITPISISTELINDGSTTSIAKKIIIILVAMILIAALAIIILINVL